MTKRRIDINEALNNPDLDLITDFLADELDPGKVAEVRRRLEDDPAFRDFAAPIVAAWNVKPRWQRDPIARAEVEKSWAKFTRRAGFTRQRRRWNRWLMMGALIILAPFLAFAAYLAYVAVPIFWSRAPVDAANLDIRLVDMPRTTTLPNGTRVILDSGATLRRLPQKPGPYISMLLEGKAAFVAYSDTSVHGDAQSVAVETKAGSVLIDLGHVEVDARGDTTDVQFFGVSRDTKIARGVIPGVSLLPADGHDRDPVILLPGERGRLVLGKRTEKLPPISEP